MLTEATTFAEYYRQVLLKRTLVMRAELVRLGCTDPNIIGSELFLVRGDKETGVRKVIGYAYCADEDLPTPHVVLQSP